MPAAPRMMTRLRLIPLRNIFIQMESSHILDMGIRS